MSGHKQKILVYGITGMVGNRVKQDLSDHFKIVGPPHSHLDITKNREVKKNILDVMPDQILYCAGITKVDYAQSHPKEAYLLNFEVVENIAKIAKAYNIPIHYISTDAVFDGKNSKRPYKENDKTNPLSTYGKSKLKGEQVVLGLSKNNSVIRTIMVYCSDFVHKKDFARLAYESLKRGEDFAAIEDQVVNPTFVDDLVDGIGKILDKRGKGIYHLAACDYTTNYGFVEKIAKAFKFRKELITKESFGEFFKEKDAPRTQYCWLDTTKFQKEFGNNILHSIDKNVLEFKRQLAITSSLPVDF